MTLNLGDIPLGGGLMSSLQICDLSTAQGQSLLSSGKCANPQGMPLMIGGCTSPDVFVADPNGAVVSSDGKSVGHCQAASNTGGAPLLPSSMLPLVLGGAALVVLLLVVNK